jgi:cytochrome c
MDSLDVNKGIAAVLVAGIAFFVTGMIGDALVRERLPEKPVLDIAAAPEASTSGPAKPAGPAPIAPLLASADPKVGESFAKKVCVACHTFDKGGKNGVGPNLYGIVGGPHDHEAGFSYSPAMQKFKGQPWTYDALNEWLYKPSAYAKGTRMSFAGIANDKQRADVIAFLRSLSESPVALPSPGEAQKAAAPAAAGAPPATTPQPAGSTKAVEPNAPAASSQPAGAPPAAQAAPAKQ